MNLKPLVMKNRIFAAPAVEVRDEAITHTPSRQRGPKSGVKRVHTAVRTLYTVTNPELIDLEAH